MVKSSNGIINIRIGITLPNIRRVFTLIWVRKRQLKNQQKIVVLKIIALLN